MAKTKRDIELMLWGTTATIPQGTAVHLVKGASGTAGDLWAVSSAKLLMDLTGNTHDPVYRYAFVDAGDVDQTA